MEGLPCIAASFDPYGLRFAVVFRALDTHRLRVVSVLKPEEAYEVALDRSVRVTSLCWVPKSNTTQPAKKKKRIADLQGSIDYSVALGTQQGIVILHNAATNTLSQLGSPGFAVASLSYSSRGLLVLTSDGKLSEWDISKTSQPNGSALLDISSPSAVLGFESLQVVAGTSPLLVANGEPYRQLSGFATPIESLALIDDNHFAAFASEDRQVLIYTKDQTVTSLMSPSYNVSHISGSFNVVSITTEDGSVLCFRDPISSPGKSPHQRSKPDLTIHLKVGSKPVPVRQTFVDGDSLWLVWVEHGSIPIFGKVKWQTSEQVITLEREPAVPSVNDSLNGRLTDPAAAPLYRDSAATVVSGSHFEDISDPEDVPTMAERLEALQVPDESLSDSESPEVPIAGPGSFAVVLNQALISNDSQLLNSCFAESDESLIKLSLLKLEPTLAAKLLEKLGTAMARSPGRTQSLMLWIRWILIIHGGYLAQQNNLLKILASLHSTLAARAACLPSLLAIQGKLDLLVAQQGLRAQRESIEEEIDEPEIRYDEDDAVIVNGEEDFSEAGSDTPDMGGAEGESASEIGLDSDSQFDSDEFVGFDGDESS